MGARRRGRDSSGHVDPFFQRRKRFEAALRPLGLWEPFSAMPRPMQEAFWKCKTPDAVLEFEAGFPSSPERQNLRSAVESGFREASIDVGGTAMPVREFLSVIVGCRLMVQFAPSCRMLEPVARFLREAQPRLDECYEQNLLPALRAIHLAVLTPLAAASRLDTCLFSAEFGFGSTPRGKAVPRVSIRATPPQVHRVWLDGGARPVYRAATLTGANGVSWVSWGAEQARWLTRSKSPPRRAANDRSEHPVYVQSHALRQLHRRVNLPAAAPYLDAWLGESLSEPRIIERHGGQDLLVEFRVQENRIGYLVVTPLREMVVVRTFKFLTMERTPERRLLEKRLRLTRRDVDWLGLHELSAFTQTDLRDDPVLRSLMEQCGCGHLFALAGEPGGYYTPRPKPFAAEVRRYLRLAA